MECQSSEPVSTSTGVILSPFVRYYGHANTAFVSQAGVIAAEWSGRFGFHNFRHSLASLSSAVEDRSKDRASSASSFRCEATLQLYSHTVSEDRMLAQGEVLEAILGRKTDESGLSADQSLLEENGLSD